MLKPLVYLILIEFFPLVPFLVVTITTPLAARAPYKAVDAASFKTVMVSISSLFKLAILAEKGTPSTTYNGALDDEIEPKPRIRTSGEEPGWPDVEVVVTPGAIPSSA